GRVPRSAVLLAPLPHAARGEPVGASGAAPLSRRGAAPLGRCGATPQRGDGRHLSSTHAYHPHSHPLRTRFPCSSFPPHNKVIHTIHIFVSRAGGRRCAAVK